MNEIGDLVVRLIADIREFMGKMDEAEAKVGEFAAVSEKSSTRFDKAMSKISTAVIGASAIIAGYSLKAAYDYGKSIEQIGFQSGASEEELNRLKKQILETSVATATSATDLANSYILIEQAGFRRAKADAIATNAAKLAKLTNTDLATATKDLLSVQSLGLNGNKSAAETTAMLVELNKQHVGTLDDLSNMFSGKLAATMKTFGISAASVGAGLSAITKHGISASVATTGLTVGMTKLMTPSATIDKNLKTIGLSQRQIADDMKKPNGLFVTLSDLKTHLLAAGVPAKDFGGYISQLAGARGAAGLGVMMQYLDDMKKAYPDLLNSQSKFTEAWNKYQQTPEFKFDKLKTQFQDAMIGLGNFVLPVVIDVADALLKAQKWLADPKHKIYTHIIADVAVGIVATAIISKITGALQSWTNTGMEAKMVAQGVTEIGLLGEIAANTLAMAGELVTVATETGVVATEAGTIATEVGTVAASKLLYGMGALMTYLPVIALILGTAFGLKNLIVDPVKKALNEIKNNIDGGAGLPDPNKTLDPKTDPEAALVQWLNRAAPAVKGSSGWFTGKQNLGNLNGQPVLQTYRITNEQKSAIDNYFKTHHMSETDKNGIATAAFSAAIHAMEMSDVNKKYSVFVTVK